MAGGLDWADCDLDAIYQLEQMVCSMGGVISKMFGGYGHYYKISWCINQQKGFISGETAHDISRWAIRVVQAGQCTNGTPPQSCV